MHNASRLLILFIFVKNGLLDVGLLKYFEMFSPAILIGE